MHKFDPFSFEQFILITRWIKLTGFSSECWNDLLMNAMETIEIRNHVTSAIWAHELAIAMLDLIYNGVGIYNLPT